MEDGVTLDDAEFATQQSRMDHIILKAHAQLMDHRAHGRSDQDYATWLVDKFLSFKESQDGTDRDGVVSMAIAVFRLAVQYEQIRVLLDNERS